MSRNWPVFLFCLFVLSIPLSASAQIASDDDYDQRRIETLREVSDRYDGVDDISGCVDAGFSTLGLMAEIKLHDLGDAQGRSASDAASEVESLADELYDLTGTPSSDCAWDQAGSPAVMHGALGLGYILHQWQSELPSSAEDAIVRALEGYWRDSLTPHLVNGSLSVVAGKVLAGEALGRNSTLWNEGTSALETIYSRVTRLGAIEVNAPLYSAYHYPPLMLLQDLEDDTARHRSRTLLEYSLLVQSHLYLPGGGLGAPQARDRYYGGLDNSTSSMHRMIWMLTGEGDLYEPAANVHLSGIASSYRMPEALRSIFLDKGEGYEFWTWADSPLGYRFPDSTYSFAGSDNVAPWQAVVTPGGNAMWGLNHGFRFQAIHVTSGVYALGDDGRVSVLYHYQPLVEGDTTDTGSGFPSSGNDTDPNDFVRELYDYQRFGHHRAFISLWDPTEKRKDSDVTRNEQYTLAHVPDYEAYGGEMQIDEESGWMVGSVRDVYVAYRPLGTLAEPIERRTSVPGNRKSTSAHYRVKLDGESGCIVELATTDEFASIDDYLTDLKGRDVSFSTGGDFSAEFEARDPETGNLDKIRLEYDPERRFVDGSELGTEQALDHGLFESPWVNMQDGGDKIVLERGCYESVTYDLPNAEIRTEPPPANCRETVFSPVEYYGDFENWEAETDRRWRVVDEDDDLRLFLRPFDFSADEDRLGEYALAEDRTFGDFEMTLTAKTNLTIDDSANADYAVVFGYQDRSNYYFLLANSTPEYSELFVLENGERTSLGVADRALIPDEDWHDLSVTREGSTITVEFDGSEVLAVDDSTYGSGRVGVGTLNDTVYFDDIDVAEPGESGTGDTGSTGDATNDVGGATTPDASTDSSPADRIDSEDGSSGADSGTGASHGGDGGCGCSASRDGELGGSALLLLAVFLVWRRRRGD